MWHVESIGTASWHTASPAWTMETIGGAAWTVRAAGGAEGISLWKAGRDDPLVTLEPVGSDHLPILAEQFVRGDELHLEYPQGDRRYALQLVLRPIETGHHRLTLEWTIAIQTSLLESHPMLDLRVSGTRIRRFTPVADPVDSPASSDRSGGARGAGAAAISSVASAESAVAVLLGPSDYPFTGDHSDDHELRLRLFGEFLEKGVIRKGRPWTMIDSSVAFGDEGELTEMWRKLCHTPLPLRG